MKKKNTTEKWKKTSAMRARYSAKRHTKKWKNRKKVIRYNVVQKQIKKRKQFKKPYLIHSAPKVFSLINNTNEVLNYFAEAERIMRNGDNIVLDISEVTELTPDTIALLVASVKDPDFTHESVARGNAPKNQYLQKLFLESGFYDHVNSQGFKKVGKDNLLHKEVDRVVVTDIAKKASLTGIKNVFKNEKPYEPLYNTIIECMSNTNNHANLKHSGQCNWWLYVYNDPKSNSTSYSFLDLGVGIFKSAVVENYVKNIIKKAGLYNNINLVDDLLGGKIKSRISKDREIRGKGIPEILRHSKLEHFKSFYLIANDVKIDLKSMKREQLTNSLHGTFWYWELI